MNLNFKQEPLSVEAINDLCISVGWQEVNPENYNLAVAKSIACISAFLDGKPVGSGRLVGDTGMYLYIQDVVVHGELQGRGIGSRIVAELEEVARGLGCWRNRIGLVAALDVCEFYEQLGYSEGQPTSKFMMKTFE